MARDIVLDVLTEAKGRGLIDAANQMDRLADRTDGTNRSLKEFNNDVEAARTRVHDLNVAFATSSGDNSGLLGDLKKAKRELKDMEGVAKALAPAGQEAGQQFSQGFLSSMGELGTGLRGALIPIAVGSAVALAPVVGAAIAGAVVGAVGAGGIAGGIAAAAQDPRVKAAASVFGKEISREFAATGDLFVQPTIQALGTLERALRDLHLEDSFAKVAPFVDDLARGIGGLATQAMPGLNRALDAAGPALELIGQELPAIGKAFGDMVGDIAESKGAMDGLRVILIATEGSLTAIGKSVAYLGDVFHFGATSLGEFAGALEDIPLLGAPIQVLGGVVNDAMEQITGTGPKMAAAWAPIPGRMDEATAAAQRNAAATEKNFGAAGQLKMSMAAAALAAKAESDALEALKRTLDGAFNAQMSVDQANLATARDMLAFKQAVDGGSKSLSMNTQAGQTNRGMLLGLVQDYDRQRQAASTSREATSAATAKFNQQVGALISLASHLGFSKSQIDALLGSYRHLQAAPNINKTITFHIATTGSVPSVVGNVGRIASFASGTSSAPPGWAWVGENGPELRKLRAGDQIASNSQSMAMANSGGGDIGVVRVIVQSESGEVLQDKLLALKRQRQLASLGF